MTPVLGIEAASALLPNEAWAIPASPEPEVKLLVVFVIKIPASRIPIITIHIRLFIHISLHFLVKP